MVKRFKIQKLAKQIEREMIWKPLFRSMEKIYRWFNLDLLTFRQLEHYRNIHSGQKVVILGNGPSLKNFDLELLKSEVTFASNKIFLAFNSTTWRPTYFTVEDDLVIYQNSKFLREKIHATSTVFIPYICKVYDYKLYGDVFYGYTFRKIFNRRQYVSADPFNQLFNGYSVVFTQMQLAIYMGASELMLIGVDFSFNLDTEANSSGVLTHSKEQNHFSADYRKPGELWNQPHLEKQLEAFALIKDFAQAKGVKIINCTPNSALDTFEKKSFSEAME